MDSSENLFDVYEFESDTASGLASSQTAIGLIKGRLDMTENTLKDRLLEATLQAAVTVTKGPIALNSSAIVAVIGLSAARGANTGSVECLLKVFVVGTGIGLLSTFSYWLGNRMNYEHICADDLYREAVAKGDEATTAKELENGRKYMRRANLAFLVTMILFVLASGLFLGAAWSFAARF